MSETPVLSLQAIRKSQLLTPQQLGQVTQLFDSNTADEDALCRLLVDCGWVTPFQLKWLRCGREAELVFGPYVLLDKIGEGGVGYVYKARHRRLNRVVALKMLREDLASSADKATRRSAGSSKKCKFAMTN